MLGKALKGIALLLTMAGAIATAAPGETRDATAPAAPRPAAPELICSDAQVRETFGGGGEASCREYLDACLGDLSTTERARWRRAVDACLVGETTVYRCYAEVPWC